MNYQLHYDKLINRAKNRILEGYTEIHHILPKCMGGTNDAFNLVILTPEEHLIAHLLLIKINPHPSLLYAAMRMYNKKSANSKNKGYGFLRRQFANHMSIRMIGENNPMYGKQQSDEQKRTSSVSNKGKISPMKGKTMSIDSRKKMSVAKKGKYIGKDNPRFGIPRSPDIIAKMRKPKKSRLVRDSLETYLIIDPNGKEYQTNNMFNFCKLFNLNAGEMRRISKPENHHRVHRGGWKARVLP
jgi:hypothetical protein